jgi:hypothetical protein
LVWAIPAGAFSQTYQVLPGSSLAIGAGTSEAVRGSLTLEAECDLVVSENCIFIGSAKYTITQLLLATDAYRFEASGEFPTLEAPNGGTLDVARALEVENTIVVGGSPVPFVSYGFDPEPTGATDTFSIWTLRGAEEAGGEPLSLARGFEAEPFRDELSLELDLSELIVEVQALGFDFAPGGRTGRASLELVVPEPTSAGLLAFGLALLGASRGRLVGNLLP